VLSGDRHLTGWLTVMSKPLAELDATTGGGAAGVVPMVDMEAGAFTRPHLSST